MDNTEAYRLADRELRALADLSSARLRQLAEEGPVQDLVTGQSGQFDVTRLVRIDPKDPTSIDLTVTVDSPNWFKLERIEEHLRVQASQC